ncbi:hypothetical protein DM806_00975 [Sphingobium lactosutens]|uniref:DNA-3-methyladenine glycosylase I n=1 Tax=Sphingobium lactosutens TaxID=522773 RepID=UPI0015BE3A47|nr:DNA-3-methyladenine glycosylase I [Sphingobium lactosutens]NWK94290.1 hypothetical protein [Sphingobium lactosutens]
MTRVIVIFEDAIASVGLAMAALQGLLLRATYVGITGILIELSGRVALTVIRATITGAQIYCEMAERGESFAEFCWSFTDRKQIKNAGGDRIASSPLSETISKEIKRRGFKFVGPTIVYAWMQAAGIVNGHLIGCFRRELTFND